MPQRPKPTKIVVRTYDVGFGDCFLLSFAYSDGGVRHVLIDFGSTRSPDGDAARRMLDVANDIKKSCGGKLHAVVATHRHRDHISGFDGDTGKVIASCEPEVVVQPWTEDPKAKPDALGPPGGPSHAKGMFGLALDEMQAFAAAVAERADHFAAGDPELARQLRFLGEDNLANTGAVDNLMTMGKKSVYVSHGSDSGLGDVLPGVRVRVLGPPTLKQSTSIRKQRARDPEEYWHLALQQKAFWGFVAGARGKGGFQAGMPPEPNGGPFPDEKNNEDDAPAHTRWFCQRLRDVNAQQMLELVRTLDKVLNNTSVILLFDVGDARLLFPGDAQIENWSFALDQKNVREELAGVTFYKVGHHGSLNATPLTLWRGFEHRGKEGKLGRLRTALSTLEGVHGSRASGTEVPRTKLVKALRADTDCVATTEFKKGEFVRQIEIPIGGAAAPRSGDRRRKRATADS